MSLEVDTALVREMTASHSTTHTAYWAWKRLLTAQPVNPLQWSFFGLHPLRDLWRGVAELYDGVRHPSVDLPRFWASLKTAIILCTTAIIAVVPALQQNWIFPEAVWAVYSYVNVISSNEGMLWGNSLNRLVGTFCGGIAGYLVLLAFGDGWVGAIVVLAVWNCGLVWLPGNLSNPASFSATIIVFGHHLSGKGTALSPQDYALTRMIEIGIGVIIAALMSAVLFPVSSLHLIRQEWKGSITQCDDALREAAEAYQQLVATENVQSQQAADEFKDDQVSTVTAEDAEGSDNSGAPLDAHLQSLLGHTGNLGNSLSRQDDLLLNIRTEPIILVVPPPFPAYLALIDSIRSIWQVSLNMEAAVRQLLLHRGLHGTAFEDKESASRAKTFLPIVQPLCVQNHRLLRQCIDVIDDEVDEWDDSPPLAEVRRLSEQLAGLVEEAAKPALSAFLYSLMQLSAETITLRRKVQRLLKAERPEGFDD